MICPLCQDQGAPVDMEHVDDEAAVPDPSDRDGVGYTRVHYFICPVCGNEEECLEKH